MRFMFMLSFVFVFCRSKKPRALGAESLHLHVYSLDLLFSCLLLELWKPRDMGALGTGPNLANGREKEDRPISVLKRALLKSDHVTRAWFG
ncbi:hypothetical protein B0T24DRAFT_114905 [Lasiosphaeria ovina]|uniref:Secreted protein n=1 Tax=Lasiosphaeria ovina TaxID=92902 RepID=A0AAE0JT83_9PEZI|nr:hypothetical protein B0T24DRAFT_114905 [Lasiosphaeria ovina]